MNIGERRVAIFSTIVMLCFVILCILPFWLLISASFTSQSALVTSGFKFIPEQFSLEAYHYLAERWGEIGRSMGISVFVTVVGTVLGVLFTALLGYALSRKETPFRKQIMILIVFTMLFSGGLIPSYLVYTQIFDLKNTIWSLLIPGLLTNGFYIMIARTFFQTTIPGEVIESAQLDGASEYRIFGSMVVPLSAPILATLGLFISIMYWNDWMNGMIYVTKPDLFSLQVLMKHIMQDIEFLKTMADSVKQNGLNQMPSDSIKMAIAVVGALPILLAYPFFQKHFIKGIAFGAVKG